MGPHNGMAIQPRQLLLLARGGQLPAELGRPGQQIPVHVIKVPDKPGAPALVSIAGRQVKATVPDQVQAGQRLLAQVVRTADNHVELRLVDRHQKTAEQHLSREQQPAGDQRTAASSQHANGRAASAHVGASTSQPQRSTPAQTSQAAAGHTEARQPGRVTAGPQESAQAAQRPPRQQAELPAPTVRLDASKVPASLRDQLIAGQQVKVTVRPGRDVHHPQVSIQGRPLPHATVHGAQVARAHTAEFTAIVSEHSGRITLRAAASSPADTARQQSGEMIARHPANPPVVQTAMLTASAAARADAAVRDTYTARGEHTAPQAAEAAVSRVASETPRTPPAGEPAAEALAADAQEAAGGQTPVLSGWLDMPGGRQVSFRVDQRDSGGAGGPHRPMTAAISLHGAALGAIDVHLVVFDDQVHAVVKGDRQALEQLRGHSSQLRSQLSGSLSRNASVEVAARRVDEPRPAAPRGFVVYG